MRYVSRRPAIDALESRLLMAVQPIISEFLASNTQTNFDEDGAASDWIEIYNPDPSPLNLSGYFLTDKADNLTKWQVPAGVSIPGGGYKLIWADEKNRTNPAAPLHTNFALSKDGEFLALVQPDGVSVTSKFDPAFPAQSDDVSYGLAGTNIATPTYGNFATPTPGAANASTVKVAAPQFSVDRGFYDSAFSLALSTPTAGATIRYTTDGSTPTTTSGTVYSGAFQVTTTKVIRAISYKSGQGASAVIAQSYIFLDDVIHQPKNLPGFPTTPKQISKGSASVAQDTQMDPAIVNGNEAAVKAGLLSIPTLSISTDFNKLFGTNGVYDQPEDKSTPEQPIAIELIDPAHPEDNDGVNGAVEGQSHDRMKRSLRLSFKEQYGPTKWKTDLLKNAPLNGDTAQDELDNLTLRAGNNRNWARNNVPAALTEDEWYRATQVTVNGEGSHGTFVHLYINGAYWGLYNVAERPDEKRYAEANGGDDEQTFAIDHDGDIKGNASRWNYLQNTLVKKDMSNASNWAELQQYVDMPEFAEYLTIAWYQGTTDWPDNNWWAAGPDTGAVRFYAWDGEKSWDRNDPESNGAYIEPQFKANGSVPIVKIFRSAIKSKEFLQLLSDTAYMLIGNDGPLSDAASQSRWDTLNNFISGAILAESARWGDIAKSQSGTTFTKAKDWTPEVAKIRGEMSGNGQDLLNLMEAQGWYSSLDPAKFAKRGGQVTPGFQMVLSNPNASSTKLYYTLDGTDPRLAGGTLSPSAHLYSGPVTLSQSADVVIRVMSGSGTSAIWSAKDEASFGINNFSALRIVEVMYAPAAPPAGSLVTDKEEYEFLEVQNTGSTAVNLNGVQVTTAIDPFTFGNVTLQPGAFATIAKNADAFKARYPSAPDPAGTYTGKLSNDGEAISLLDPTGATIQAFTWAATWYPATKGGGPSLMIVNNHAEASTWNTPDNWRAGQINGTPGAANDPPPVNHAPFVDAGLDRNVVVSATTSLTLDASVTDDGLAPGGPVTFSWSQVDGPGTVTFGPNAIDTLVSFPSITGMYTLKLTATDGATPAVSDTVVVTVLPEPPNQAPVVSAGPDRVVTLPNGLSLDGIATDDGKPTGQPLTIGWSVVSGPGMVTFGAPGAADTTATFSAAGEYILKLAASDTEFSTEDTVKITVSAQPVVQNAITGFTLFNASTGAVIQTLSNGDTLNLANLPAAINVRANEASSTVKSVRFGFDSTPGTIKSSFRTDDSTQFTLFSQGDGGSTFKTGNHTLRATPFTSTGAGGAAGAVFQVQFSVINAQNPIPPAAPGSLSATTLSSSSIKLDWADLSDNEAGFEIVISTDNVHFTPKGSVGAGIRTFTATGLLPNQDYWFQVRAINTFGQSSYVASPVAHTPIAPAAPAITGLVLINSDTGQAVISLTDGMTIQRSQFSSLKNFNVRADANALTNSVIFGFNGNANYREEDGSPFALFGNKGADYKGQSFKAGTYSVTVRPFASSNFTGTPGATYTLTFKVV